MGELLALVELVALSDVGRVRHHNEDRALGRLPVIAVADGMGGAKAGEIAAQMAVDEVGSLPGEPSVDDVRAAVVRANDAIHRTAHSDAEKAGMGTTLTAAVLAGAALGVVHVGDSRAYLWREGALTQITEDHSVVAELVRRGSLSAAEAEVHPHRNVITRALGAERSVSPDVVNQPLRAGDLLLLCTDGLSTYVPDSGIAAALSGSEDLGAVARDLVARANRAGGADNITVVLARVAPDPDARDRTATFDTVEEPIPSAGPGSTAKMRVLGGVHGHAGTDREGAVRASAPPRVLEPAGRRRRWRAPALAIGGVALILVAGAVWWGDSRIYSLEAGPDGSVMVAHGLPISLGGLDLAREWQTIGVSSAAVAAGRPQALSRTWRGQGEAVAAGVDLIWRFGLPEPPTLVVPTPGPGAEAAPAPDEPATPTTLEPPEAPGASDAP